MYIFHLVPEYLATASGFFLPSGVATIWSRMGTEPWLRSEILHCLQLFFLIGQLWYYGRNFMEFPTSSNIGISNIRSYQPFTNQFCLIPESSWANFQWRNTLGCIPLYRLRRIPILVLLILSDRSVKLDTQPWCILYHTLSYIIIHYHTLSYYPLVNKHRPWQSSGLED